MLIENLTSSSLNIDRFTVQNGEAWCLFGSNRSGIDQFLQIFTGDSSRFSSEKLTLPSAPAIVSFALQQEVFEDELKNDDTNFLDKIDPGTPAKDFLKGGQDVEPLIDALGMRDVLHRGYRQLSTGESRKLLVLQVLSVKNDFLIIENPYEGLDRKSCQELDRAMASLKQHIPSLIITVNNRCDIPDWCTHIAHFHGGTISCQGTRAKIIHSIPDKTEISPSPLITSLEDQPAGLENNKELVLLEDGSASYGTLSIFSKINLKVNEGQHTLITGPNGSGKSTLLQILSGDNQKCYSNRLRMFGRARGTGESIWELKRHMGLVGSDLHRNYRAPGSALQVVISGLFDSIGVYRHFSDHQRKQAEWWLSLLGMADKSKQSFKRLTYAEQRLVLIARALIKMPQLLILDEPTQGLDEENRESLLIFLEKVSEKRLSTIIYASHRQDEFRNFFQQHIRLENYSSSQ